VKSENSASSDSSCAFAAKPEESPTPMSNGEGASGSDVCASAGLVADDTAKAAPGDVCGQGGDGNSAVIGDRGCLDSAEKTAAVSQPMEGTASGEGTMLAAPRSAALETPAPDARPDGSEAAALAGIIGAVTFDTAGSSVRVIAATTGRVVSVTSVAVDSTVRVTVAPTGCAVSAAAFTTGATVSVAAAVAGCAVCLTGSTACAADCDAWATGSGADATGAGAAGAAALTRSAADPATAVGLGAGSATSAACAGAAKTDMNAPTAPVNTRIARRRAADRTAMLFPERLHVIPKSDSEIFARSGNIIIRCDRRLVVSRADSALSGREYGDRAAGIT
jgi:hypothetical protein